MDERLLTEILLNPVDVLCHTRDFQHYGTFRRLAWERDWVGFSLYLKTCVETAVVDTVLSLIKEVSPRSYAIVTTD